MTTALATRVQKALLTLWTQLDVEKGSLPSKSCRFLLEELKELQDISVPPGYASSSQPLQKAIDMLQDNLTFTTSSLSLASATSLAALLAETLNLLASPLTASTAYDPSRPTLPSEIISLILHQLAVRQHTVDVAACCLVSRSFLPLARGALYHTLYLGIRDQKCDDDGVPLDLCNSARRGSDLAINYGRLSSKLALHPHLASLVRQVELAFAISSDTLDLASGMDVALSLLEACRAQVIRPLNADPNEAARSLHMLWQCRQRFRAVDIVMFYFDEEWKLRLDAALRRLLQEQDTLKAFSLRWGESEIGGDLPNFQFRFKLEQLHLIDFDLAHSTIANFEAFTLHSATTLTHLSIPSNASADPYIAPRLSHFQNLQTLSLWVEHRQISSGSSDTPERQRCRDLFEDLPPSVESMTLTGERETSRIVSLDHVPLQLHFLDVRSLRFSPSTLLNYARSRSRRLCRLRYFDGGASRRVDSDPEWNEASSRGVASVLAELGIEGN